MSPSTLALAFVLVALGTTIVVVRKTRSRLPLPPGPKPLPLVGNFFDMPAEMEWLKFTEWGKRFGDIMSVTIFGQPIIVINSYQVASELLDKIDIRPSEACDGRRTVGVILLFTRLGMVGWVSSLPLTPYGERFRAIRKYMAGTLAGKPAKQFEGLQEQNNVTLCQNLLDSPEKFREHIRFYVGSVILKISHGYDVALENDSLVALADKANEEFSKAAKAGAFLVDVLPWLRYIPDWFPGAEFKKTAKAWRQTALDLNTIPYKMVLQQVKSGTAPPSFLSAMLEDRWETMSRFDEDVIRWAATGLYSGGADTTVSAITNFFLAMVLNPDVQLKAQAEIDSVIGSDRLPGFTDRPYLPYVDALVKEVLRWGAVGPIGIPHLATADCSFNGYAIPKGAIVIANIWGIHYDERSYPNPTRFDPGRYLNNSTLQRDPHLSVFGFGRRVCPGLSLADASLYLSCVRTLALFNITKATDIQGIQITPEATWLSGVISRAAPFKCEIKPRSALVSSLVLENIPELSS